MSSCDICALKHTSKRFEIECSGCKGRACVSCCSKYILDNTADTPTCLFPGHCPWSDEFMTSRFPIHFMKKLISAQKDICFEQEKSKISNVLGHVESYKQYKKLDLPINDIQKQIRRVDAERNRLSTQCSILVRKKQNLLYSITNTKKSSQANGYQGILVKCPVVDCTGYLKSMKCVVCDSVVCQDCHKPIGNDNHECLQEDKDSTEYIRQNSKPCPKCGTRISKIDGCDQMWCVNPKCQSAFSWRTGVEIKGHFHNPEYYRFMREQGSNIQREEERIIGCNEGDGYTLNQWIRIQKSTHHDFIVGAITKILNVHRLLYHLQYIERNITDKYDGLRNSNTNLDFVMFIMNEKSEDDFKKQIQKTFHRISRAKMYLGVFVSINTVLGESLRYLSNVIFKDEKFKNVEQTVQKCNDVLNRCSEACACANSELKYISKRFCVKQHEIGDNFETANIVGVYI